MLQKGTFLLLFILAVTSANMWATTGDSTTAPIKNTDYTYNPFAESGGGNAYVTGTHKVYKVKFWNPVKDEWTTTQAGTFKGKTFEFGSTTGNDAYLYCIDLGHNVQWWNGSNSSTYYDAGKTSNLITYVLNKYYPFVPHGDRGDELSDIKKEAAAVQVAIWHFSDGLDPLTITNNTPLIRERAIDIIQDALDNVATFMPDYSIVMHPFYQKLVVGNDGDYSVEVLESANGNNENVEVIISSEGGSSFYTDANGIVGPFTITSPSGEGTVTFTAIANVWIPEGTRFYNYGNPHGVQKLVLAKPAKGSLTAEGMMEWVYETDLVVTKEANPVLISDGGLVTYTITLLNNGQYDAASIEVTDLLPSGAVYQNHTGGSYDPLSGSWNVGSLNAGNSTSIEITVEVDASLISTGFVNFGAASDFNLFVLENLNQPSSDTEGKVAVGNNATLNNYSVGDKLTLQAPPEDVLIVGNHLQYGMGRVYNGNVVYGVSTNLPKNSVSIDEGILRQDTPIDFAAAEAYLKNLSTFLSTFPANGVVVNSYGLTLNGNDPDINIFSVSGSDLSNANSIEINVPQGSAVLVNISGTSVNWMGGLVVNNTTITNVLYNFYEAESFTLGGIDVQGSILAPCADLDFAAGVVNGQVIVKSMTGSGQFNHSLFTGNIPTYDRLVNTAVLTSLRQFDIVPENNYDEALVTLIPEQNTPGWQQSGSLDNGEMFNVFNAINDGALLAGTNLGNVYRSMNDGEDWTSFTGNLNVNRINALTEYSGTLYAATDAGIFTYEAGSWSNAGLSGTDVKSIALSNGVMYVATAGQGIFKSMDGENWTQKNNELPSLFVQNLLAVNNEIYAATFGGGLAKSDDGGSTWQSLDFGFDHVTALAAAEGMIYAGTYGSGVYMSADNGATWQRTEEGIPAQFIYDAVIDNNKNLYVSTLFGSIYVLESGSSVWQELGLSGKGINTLYFDGNANNLYASTKDGGLFVNKDGVTSADNLSGTLPVEFALHQNYPNPFNPSTVISYSLPESEKVSLKIYDILGNEVAELVNDTQPAGQYQVTFNAGDLASGVYLYRIQAGSFNATKKLMLMK